MHKVLIFPVAFFLIIAGSVIFIHQKTTKAPKNQATTLSNPSSLHSTPKPSNLPKTNSSQNQPTFSSQITISQSNISPSGQTTQISCNYNMPPSNQPGSVKINSNWSNLTIGKSGSSKLELCVSVNGNNTLIASDNHQSGSRTDTYEKISQGSSYSFSLYDTQGGDLPDCNNTPLSTCQINSNNPLPPLNSRSI